MNLIERYALATGLKIEKPFIYQKYFPLPFDKYITFHPVSKPSKNYDYWQDVLDDLSPILESMGIKIVQIGAKEDHKYERCIRLCGLTSINQVAYLVSHSLLHLSTDTFSAHVAGSLNKKIVALYSNSYASNCKPYWGSPENQILIEPERKPGERPSFALEESPKQINRIKTEQISNAVLSLLGIKEKVPYETVFVGEKYQNGIFYHTVIPNSSGPFVKMNDIEVRMDKHFDENFLRGQLSVAKCAVMTDRPFSEDILEKFKPNIGVVFFFVNDESGAKFCRKVISMGIPLQLVSRLSEEKIAPLKIHFYEFGNIIKVPEISEENLSLLKGVESSNLQIKSNKIYTRGSKRYYSMPDVWNDHPCQIPFVKPFTSTDITEDGSLEDYEFLKITKRLD